MWAIVLCGGRSRRMGRPKQDLPFGDGTLLDRVVGAARRAAEEVVLVGDGAAAMRLGARAAEDHQPGAGPLSGLAGGLAACPPGRHALLACDLPFLDPVVLRVMADAAAGADAVVPEVDGRLHPLCALYDSACAEAARGCLDEGRRRMEDLLARIRVRVARPEEFPPGCLAAAVRNVNTPDEYRRALQILEVDRDGR